MDEKSAQLLNGVVNATNNSKEENVRYLRKFFKRTRILNVNNKKTQELILMSIKKYIFNWHLSTLCWSSSVIFPLSWIICDVMCGICEEWGLFSWFAVNGIAYCGMRWLRYEGWSWMDSNESKSYLKYSLENI